MLNEALKLIMDESPILLDTAPQSTVILIGVKGNWQVDDFIILWANAASKRLLGHIMGTGTLKPTTLTNHHIAQANLDRLKKAKVRLTRGFIGPFSISGVGPKGKPHHIDYSMAYIGSMGADLPVILKTATAVHPQREIVVSAIRINDADNPALMKLTPRQRQIAIGICRGANNLTMAKELGIDLRTVENHRTIIRKKLGIADRSETILAYIRKTNRRIPGDIPGNIGN